MHKNANLSEARRHTLRIGVNAATGKSDGYRHDFITMNLDETIQRDSVLCNANARSKKHCIEILSELLVRSIPDTPADDVFARLIERERLGCTSLNAGVAFPHCRVAGLEKSCAALIKLSEPVDFDCSDGEPVDLVFGLLVPEDVDDSHVAVIRGMSRVLADDDLREKLRECNSSKALHSTLIAAATSLGGAPDKPVLKAAEGY